jgi:1,2-diacylglycerol 3-beta-galactosyltransferase
MNPTVSSIHHRKHIVFLMSDTGAGHRAVANAIQAAIDTRYPGAYAFGMVDIYRHYTPVPFKYMPEIYPPWINYAKRTWEFGYKFVNTHRRGRLFMALLKRWWRDGMSRFVVEHPADVIVSVHALFSRPVMHAFHRALPFRPPFVTVITDLVSTHAFWYERDVERCLVPTQAAYDRGRGFGLDPAQLRITGLPIHPQFVNGLLEKCEARQKLGWHPTLPAVLLIGGGDGMGPVLPVARALNDRHLPMQLIVIAGRNGALQRRLEVIPWHQPTHIHPFVNNMPEFMAAADMLVTKAGPTTICEACIAGLPMVLSSHVPGQEDGNIDYVVNGGAGVYAPGPSKVADAITDWLSEGASALAARSRNARALGRPDAVWAVAEEIHVQAQHAPIRTRFRNSHRQNGASITPLKIKSISPQSSRRTQRSPR